jgi:hypothetical protein
MFRGGLHYVPLGAADDHRDADNLAVLSLVRVEIISPKAR